MSYFILQERTHFHAKREEINGYSFAYIRNKLCEESSEYLQSRNTLQPVIGKANYHNMRKYVLQNAYYTDEKLEKQIDLKWYSFCYMTVIIYTNKINNK
ncbi:MAG: hypothetical protein RDU01_07365 [Thermodesulfovibrionales bacterium]|nr:hypothetical protein [Thermodesulfovibrionales bacterium]